MIRNMDMAYTLCRMEGPMKDGGQKVNSMAQARSYSKIVRIPPILRNVDKTNLMKAKKGLWEDGKRIMWLDSPGMAVKIESGELDYRSLMQMEENKLRVHVSEFANKF